MEIQCEKLWLFETELVDPFFLGEKDGITARMSKVDSRLIDFVNIKKVYFYIDTIAKIGITYNLKYGGEDTGINESFGKSRYDFELSFNVPTNNQVILEKLVGKQFSLVGMRRDLSFFLIFAQLEVGDYEVDNEVVMRITFKAKNTNSKIFSLNSFNIEEIIDTITEDNTSDGGFDYEFDMQLD